MRIADAHSSPLSITYIRIINNRVDWPHGPYLVDKSCQTTIINIIPSRPQISRTSPQFMFSFSPLGVLKNSPFLLRRKSKHTTVMISFMDEARVVDATYIWCFFLSFFVSERKGKIVKFFIRQMNINGSPYSFVSARPATVHVANWICRPAQMRNPCRFSRGEFRTGQRSVRFQRSTNRFR